MINRDKQPPRRNQYQSNSGYYYSPSRPAYTPRPQKQRNSGIVLPIIVLSLIGLGAFFGWQKFVKPLWSDPAVADSSDQESTEKESAPEPPPAPVIPTTTKAEMDAQIADIIARNATINVGVSVINLKTGEATNYGLPQAFHAASTAKVLTAAYLLDRVEAGAVSLSQMLAGKSVGTHLKLMIEQSDNASWESLNVLVGYASMQAYAHSIGMADYSANQNSMSAASMALLLNKIYRKELLNEANTNLLLEHMKNANRTDLVLPALPAEVTAYHKAGWLDDRTHDAVIIINENTPYVLVIFTKGYSSADLAQRNAITQAITAATVDHFISSEVLSRTEAAAAAAANAAATAPATE